MDMDNIIDMTIVYLDDGLNKVAKKDSISSNTKGKLLAIDCLRCYFQKKDKIRRFVEIPDNHPKLGHLLSVLCNLAKSDKSRQVRIDSINFIKELLDLLGANHLPDGLCTIGLVSFFLPGVCSSLIKLVMSDDKLPVNLTIGSIQALTKLMHVAFTNCNHVDSNKANAQANVSEYIVHLHGQELTITCDNLAIRISNLFKYMMSSNSREELTTEVLHLCECIVDIPRRELITKLLDPIIQYVISNIADNVSDVGSTASNIVDKIKILCDTDDTKEFNGLLMNNLIKILKELPNICRGSLFSEKRIQLSLLRGYIICLSPEALTQTLMIEDNRKLLFESLIEISELNSSQHSASTGDPIKMITDSDNVSKQNVVERNFRFLDEELLVELIKDCCLKLGEKCDSYILFDCINSTINYYNFSPSTLFITMNLLSGATSQKSPVPLGLVRGLITTFLNFLSSRYSAWLHDHRHLTSKENSRYIHQITLATESFVPLSQLNIASSKSVPQKNHFLRIALCPLLDMASCTNVTVSNVSLTTLECIARVYSEKSIQGLIESNVDYIVDTVSSKLENYAHNNEIPNVIAIAFKLSSAKMFCYFQDIFDRALKVLDEFYHSETSLPLVVLFYRIVTIIDEWFPQDTEALISLKDNMGQHLVKVKDEISITKRLSKLKETKKNLIETRQAIELESNRYRQRRETSDSNMMDDAEEFLNDRNNENLQKNEDENEKKQIPYHIELVEKIVRRFAHLLSSRNIDIKLCSLKTISLAMRVLREEENILLPLAHTVWLPLINGLTRDFNKNLEVTRCSFQCMVSMSIHSKDFLKARTLTDVIPKVCAFLKSQLSHSKNQDSFSSEAYVYSLAFKCQHELLEQIGLLVYHINLAYSSLWKVIGVVMLYLDEQQPQCLRASAKESLLYMFLMDPDCMYYFAKRHNCLEMFPFSEIYYLN